jgi:hypothetical protein
MKQRFYVAFFMSMDGLADNCSCYICTYTISDGRMSQDATDGSEIMS